MGLASQALIPLIKCQGEIAPCSIGPLPSYHPACPGLESTSALGCSLDSSADSCYQGLGQ